MSLEKLYKIIFLILMSTVTDQRQFTAYEFDKQECNTHDVMFTYVTPTAVICAAICHSDQLCVGLFYKEKSQTCVGCSTFYSAEVSTGLINPVDARYYFTCGDDYDYTWNHYNDKSFKLVYKNFVYSEAKRHCNMLCSDLAHVDTMTELQVLKAIVMNSNVFGAYIGLEYIQATGEWVWGHDGSLANVSDWDTGEPNLPASEHCVALRRDSNYKWADVSCFTTVYYFVCQKTRKSDLK